PTLGNQQYAGPGGFLHPVDGSLQRVRIVTGAVCVRAEFRIENHRARIVRSNRVERPGVNGTGREEDRRDESRQRRARTAHFPEENFHGERAVPVDGRGTRLHPCESIAPRHGRALGAAAVRIPRPLSAYLPISGFMSPMCRQPEEPAAGCLASLPFLFGGIQAPQSGAIFPSLYAASASCISAPNLSFAFSRSASVSGSTFIEAQSSTRSSEFESNACRLNGIGYAREKYSLPARTFAFM